MSLNRFVFGITFSSYWIRQQGKQFEAHFVQGTDSEIVKPVVCPLSDIIVAPA